MNLRVIGAGLPRTGTSSLRFALEHLLGGSCVHMSVIPGHPFNLGHPWDDALADRPVDWHAALCDHIAAVDWPASAFWEPILHAFPNAIVLLSTRESATKWYESMNATVLPVIRMAMASDWKDGVGGLRLVERFARTKQWDDSATLMAAYEMHNEHVRNTVPRDRLLEWRAQDGWEPICRALKLPVPEIPFPHLNKREDWG